MKRYLRSALLTGTMAVASLTFAQLQDEQNVSITMDLQPILQLKMEGPDQLDFTFDEINKYYAGVTKYGANILKVSASVSFDLWAVGLSTGSIANERIWDNPLIYGVNGAGVAGNQRNQIPLTALELHQWPANPSVAAACANIIAASAENYDYSSQFAPYSTATNALGGNQTNIGNNAANTLGNNTIYCQVPGSAYDRPNTAAAAADEKYIAGALGTGAGCQVNAGSYLFGSVSTAGVVGNSNASQTSGGYYFVMDYRILPGLPARFPATVAANNTNAAAAYLVAAAADGDITATANTFAAPGVYTMYVKYILQEDQ